MRFTITLQKDNVIRPFKTVFLTVLITFAMIVAPGRSSVKATGQTTRQDIKIGEKDFLLNGKPFVIRSGEVHAPRIPPEYWRHWLKMVKAMGCNTVCAYLFWNQHEPEKGRFDFTGSANAAEYCRIAHEVGLKVILRPGPYSCAEWDLGGFPWWLLKYPDIKLRTQDPRYLEACRKYLLEVGKQLAPLQITHGGPIIMVQVENEYGSYGSDREYIGKIRDFLVEAGFEVPLFTCDGPVQLNNDVREDIFSVVNFGGDPAGAFEALRSVRPKGPMMCGEYYPGWFDHWGKPHHYGDTQRMLGDLKYMLEHRASFSIYMVHGGTSFGFWVGANSPPYNAQTTSYDYDAPISEAGWATEKYLAIRSLFSQYLQEGESMPPIPAPFNIIGIPEFELTESALLFDHLKKPHYDKQPKSMEMYDQGWGCILYRTKLPAGKAATLTINDVHDWAQVFIDKKRVGILDRRGKENSIELPERLRETTLDILIEALGRINYGLDLHDRKGITEKVTLTENDETRELYDWQIYNIPLDEQQLRSVKYRESKNIKGPVFFRDTFHLKETGDTFLDMRKWKKGVVWVNGHNLGRYWHIGPQQTLYLPGCWLRKGENEITIFELDGIDSARLQGLKKPILDQVRP